jgi:hypothetical protein
MKKLIVIVVLVVASVCTLAWSRTRNNIRIELKLKVTNLDTNRSYLLATTRLVAHGDGRAETISDCVQELLRASSEDKYAEIEKGQGAEQ